MPLSIAMIGCGGMARAHLNGLIELNKHRYDFKLTSVCDTEESRTAAFAETARKEMGMQPTPYRDFRLMLEESRPDAVIIATDHRLHHVLSVPCLEAGCHVMTEKPLAITIRAGKTMIDAAERSGVILAVAEQYRRGEEQRAIKAALDAGAIGRPYMIFRQGGGVGSGIFCGTPWRHMKEDVGGGPMLDNGVHDADLFIYWLGSVEEVTAATATFESSRSGKTTTGEHATIQPTADDTGLAIVRFTNGALGQWSESWAMHGAGFGHTVIYGSEGSINDGVLNRDGEDPVDRETLIANYRQDDLFPHGITNSVTLEQLEFLECIKTGGRPEIDGKVGMEAQAICYAVYESAAAGGVPIKVQDVVSGKVDAYQRELNHSLGI